LIRILRKKKSANASRRTNLIAYMNPDSLIAEQYRTIRTNIQFSCIDDTVRSIIITSPGFGEGKSTITANLGVSMAEQGKKVLIIDADIRKPTMHTIFKIKNEEGLSSVLLGKISLKEAVFQTEIGRLGVLTSGPKPFNSSKVLDSKAVKELTEAALEYYDIVLFDSPPVLEVTDTQILSNQCDGVILVLSCGKTGNEKAVEAERVLKIARAKLLGVILNEKK
jgi:protein-tyrosine kinase